MTLRKILIVEDSKLVHAMYDMLLAGYRARGTAIVHTFDGQQGLDALHEHTDVDLVIMDLNMPVMDGFEFLKHTKAELAARKIPAIIVSTKANEGDLIRGLEAGASAYLTKPFSASTLREAIEEVSASPVDGGEENRAPVRIRAQQALAAAH